MKKALRSKKKNTTVLWKSRAWIILVALGILSYANTLLHDFALDDSIVITENMYTVQGVKGWKGLLSKDTFYGFFRKEGKANLVSGGRYRPLSPMFFSLEYQLFGENPLVFHLTNILLYGLLIGLLYLWLQRLLIHRDHAFWLSFATVLIFTVHPLHTEVVANIKGRDEILALLFSVLAAFFTLRGVEKKEGNTLDFALSGLFFFLGLMSKENTITFLLIIPASIYFFRKANFKELIRPSLAPLAATLLFLVVRYSVIGSGISEPPMELMNNPFLKFNGSGYEQMSHAEKLPMILWTLGKYLLLFVFPHPLTHDYYPKVIEMMSFGDPRAWGSLVAYLLLIFWMIRSIKKAPEISWAILFFLASLSVVSNVFFAVGTLMSERFLFMPSLGLSLLFVYVLHKGLQHRGSLFPLCILIVSSLFLLKTLTRNPAWKDNYTLFTTDIVTSKKSAKLQNAVGGILLEDLSKVDDQQEKNNVANRAIEHLKKAKEIHPTYKSPNLLLGNAYFYKEDYGQAQQYFQLALRQDNNFSDAKMNLALCERELGNHEKSIDLLQSLTQDPRIGDRAKAQLLISFEEAGKAYSQKGALQQALNQFQKGLNSGGDPAKFNYFVGVTHAQMNDLTEALRYLTKALEYPSEEDNRQNILRAYNQVKKDLENIN